MRVLTRSDVRRAVPMADAVDLMKMAFAELSAGRAISPLRTVIPVEPGRSDALVMPAFVPAAGALGLKAVSVFGGNHARGLPVINAVVLMIDSETGRPQAILDGTYITALRTGAVAGAAADLLARADSRVLVVIGPGAQGMTQVAAVCAVRPIERVIVVGRSESSLAAFRQRMADGWPELVSFIETTTNTESAVRQADIVCTATSSRTPVFADVDIRAGAHLSAVGAYTPEMAEVPPETVTRASVFVDAIDAALAEAGDLIQPLAAGRIGRDHIKGELGELVTGQIPGRTSADEITFFKSVGNAVQDVVVGRRALDRATELGLGTTLDLD